MLKFFNDDESLNESDSQQEDSFTEYIGTVLPECESDGSFSDQASSGNNSSANDLLESETQTTNHEPAAAGDEQGEAERDKTQHADTQKELDSKFLSVYPWDSSESEASVSSEVESISKSQHHADESADNVAESVHLCEISTSESDTGIVVGWIAFQERHDPLQCLTAVFNSLMNYEGLNEGLLRDLKC